MIIEALHCKAFLILGSNLEDRIEHLNLAEKLLSSNDLRIIQRSSIYETEAWGDDSLNSFLNMALEVNTTLSPFELLDYTKRIELKLGRTGKGNWTNRTIDIDIAYYENLIINIPELQIPQKNLERRKFALIPMIELDSEHVHPILLKDQKQLLESCEDQIAVKKYIE